MILALLAAVTYFCCAPDLGRWSAARLAATERGIRIRLAENAPQPRVADLYLSGGAARFVIPADQRTQRPRRCPKAIPYRPPGRAEAVALRPHLRVGNTIEEAPAACFERDGVVWFGLGFYEGQGSDGVGGIGRWDPRTGGIEVRRPQWLSDKSVTALVQDGRYLWLAASQQYEKSVAEHGLARFDWTTGTLTPVPICALGVNDLLLDRGSLWVAEGSAVSRLDLQSARWTHFLLARDGGALTPAPCRALLRRILDAPRWAEPCEGDASIETVARFDPDLVRDYLGAHPIARSWRAGRPDELPARFAAGRAGVLNHSAQAAILNWFCSWRCAESMLCRWSCWCC